MSEHPRIISRRDLLKKAGAAGAASVAAPMAILSPSAAVAASAQSGRPNATAPQERHEALENLTATDADQAGLTMAPVGPLPAWATFSDLGSGTAVLSGVPQSGQAGTYPVSIRAADDRTATTVSFNIVIAPSAQVGVDERRPFRFRLAPSPNPFHSGIDLEFELEHDAQVNLVVLDLQGRTVRDLVAGQFPAGPHHVTWEGQDDHHAPVGPGLYFARLVTGDGQVQVQKLFKIR